MQCKYIKRTITAGNFVEIEKTESYVYGEKIARGIKNKPTPEDVKKINEINAARKLKWLINSNFGYNDIHATLTYRPSERRPPPEAQKLLSKFLEKAKAIYLADGLEFKYISVTEYKRKAIHHHLVIPGIDIRKLTDIWPYGKIRPTYLDNTGNYELLADYLIKETSKTFKEIDGASRKRWNASKNLTKPVIKTEIVKAKSWKAEPKPLKGYFVLQDSIYNGVCEITGRRFQRYSMLKLWPTGLKINGS